MDIWKHGRQQKSHSTGNKQEELEAIVQQENYDIVVITESWGDDLHNWSASVNSSAGIGKEGETVG